MTRIVFALALSLAQVGAAWSQDLTLTQFVGPQTIVYDESVRTAGDLITAEIRSNLGEFDSLVMDKNRSTLEWRRRIPAKGTDILAVRSGTKVKISGALNGKAYDQTVDFGALPWYQFQEISYEYLFASGASSSSFWTLDRLSLKPSEFRAERKGEEAIEVMGKRTPAVRYTLNVQGVPRFLFTAQFWTRSSDGRFLRLDVPPVLGSPRTTVELTSEE